MSVSLGGEQLGSSQEPSSFWKLIFGEENYTTHTDKHRRCIYHLEKNPKDTSGEQWILDQFQGVGQ